MPDGSFFHKYVNDAYRFLPEDDRRFLSEFWTALLQAAGNVQQALLEANLNRYLNEMLTFATDRWRRYNFGVASVASSVVTDVVTFTSGPEQLSNERILSFGLLVTRTSDGSQYTYGTDYTVDGATGQISRPSGSAIPNGSPTSVRYTYSTTVPADDDFPYEMAVDDDIVSIPVLQSEITPTASTTTLYENVDFIVGSGRLAFKVQPPPFLWAERTFVDNETPYRRFGVLVDYYLSNSPQYVQALRGLYYAYFKGSQVETIENAVRLLLSLPSALRAGWIIQVRDTTTMIPIASISKPYTIETDGSVAITELLEHGLVRVAGVGGYARALRVASTSGTTVVLADDALDDYDSASPPAGVDPADVQLYIPRQVGYLGDDGIIRYEEVHPDLNILVSLGQQVARYQPFTDGTQVIDKVVNPDFVIDEVGRAGIQRFLTDAATTGTAASTDESIALQTLSSHLWVMQIHGAVFNYVIGLADINTFLEKIRPKYTTYVLQILENFDEPVGITATEETDVIVDLTYTVNSNTPNVEVFAVQMPVVSFIKSTRILTVVAPHDLTVFAQAGESVELDGLSGDDGVYTIEAVLSATTMRLAQTPSADHPAPAAAHVYVLGTDEEYSAASGYPYMNVGAGHPHIDESLEAEVVFQAELNEIRLEAGPEYFLDSTPGSTPAKSSHFTMWQLELGVDQVTVAGSTQDGVYTVAEVVSDGTLRVVESVVDEGPAIAGTITITKIIDL